MKLKVELCVGCMCSSNHYYHMDQPSQSDVATLYYVCVCVNVPTNFIVCAHNYVILNTESFHMVDPGAYNMAAK